jgi:hypothetical protein
MFYNVSVQVVQADNGRHSVAVVNFRSFESAIAMVDEMHETVCEMTNINSL